MYLLFNMGLVSQTLSMRSSRKALRRDEELGFQVHSRQTGSRGASSLSLKGGTNLCGSSSVLISNSACAAAKLFCSEPWPCVSIARRGACMRLMTLSKQGCTTHLKPSFPHRWITVFGFFLAVELPQGRVILNNILSLFQRVAANLSPIMLPACWSH